MHVIAFTKMPYEVHTPLHMQYAACSMQRHMQRAACSAILA